jgi:hypothetical protein
LHSITLLLHVSEILTLLGLALFGFNRFLTEKLVPSNSSHKTTTAKDRTPLTSTLIGLVATVGLVFGVSKVFTDYNDIPDTIVSGSLVILSLFVLLKYEALDPKLLTISLIFAVGSAFLLFGYFGVIF